jgi:DNA modification methylase
MGFDFVGFEIDKRYFDLAQARLDEARAQIAMEIRVR